MIVAIGLTLVLGPFAIMFMMLLGMMYIDMIYRKQWIGLALCTSMLLGLALLGIDLVRFAIAN